MLDLSDDINVYDWPNTRDSVCSSQKGGGSIVPSERLGLETLSLSTLSVVVGLVDNAEAVIIFSTRDVTVRTLRTLPSVTLTKYMDGCVVVNRRAVAPISSVRSAGLIPGIIEDLVMFLDPRRVEELGR